MGKEKQRPDVLKALGYVKTDALSNLEAKRGCTWANRLIVSTIEAVERFETVRDFYYKEEKTEFKDMFSAFLQRPDGYLELWQKACDACVSEKVPPSKDEAEAVGFAGGLLWQMLFCIVGLPTAAFSVDDGSDVVVDMRAVAEKDGEENRKALMRAIQFHTLNVAETCYRLTVLEWKIWYLHKEWSVNWAENDSNGPIGGRGAIEALYPALRKFDEEHPYVFFDLRLALHGLYNASDALPRAFVYRDSETAPLRTCEKAVIHLLTIRMEIAFKYPREIAAVIGYGEEKYIPSRFLQRSRGRFIALLYDNLRANAKNATSDVSRRMWLEAAAELFQRTSLSEPVFAKKAADRIVELTNRAQRESWIERKMEQVKKGGKTEDVEFPPASAEPEPAKPTPIDLKAMEEKFMAQARGYVDGRLDALKKRKSDKGGGNKATTRGRQTPVMIDQFAALQVFLNENNVPRNCSYATLRKWINSFWNKHRTEYEKTAKAKGDKKGYGSVTMMFRAAKKKGYGQ